MAKAAEQADGARVFLKAGEQISVDTLLQAMLVQSAGDAILTYGIKGNLFRQLDAGAHGMVADKFHHLRTEFLPINGTIAGAGMIHEVSQPHDAQTNAADTMSGLLELRHGDDGVWRGQVDRNLHGPSGDRVRIGQHAVGFPT